MLLIFDWDGTLMDSKAKITESMHLAVKDLAWDPLEDAAVHNIIGLGLPEAIARLFPGRNLEECMQLKEAYARHFIRLDEEAASSFFPFVGEVLGALKQQGHWLTLATGKSRKGLDRLLKNLELESFFNATRCADETASKPHPLMLEELLTEFGVRAQEAVMVGDTEYDMAMAKAIDMPRIAVSYGAHHIDRLRPYDPELCMDCFSELLGWERLVP